MLAMRFNPHRTHNSSPATSAVDSKSGNEPIGEQEADLVPVHCLLSALAGKLMEMGRTTARRHHLNLEDFSCRIEGDMTSAHSDEADREVRLTLSFDTPNGEQGLAAWLEEMEKRCPCR